MSSSNGLLEEGAVAAAVATNGSPPCRRSLIRFGGFALLLAVGFSKPLFDLVRHAATTDLYSHILLIPFISAYLVWQQRREVAAIPCRPSGWGMFPIAVGALLGGTGLWLLRRGWHPALEDYLCLITFSFYSFLLGGGFLFLGSRMMRAVAFPAAFLVFIVPFPVSVMNALETFFQYASADAASGFMSLIGLPFLRDGLQFQLPGISIRVAQECSGIRSSLVLFIVSLLAGHLFLRRGWTRASLTGFVIPLAILRNGFRVATISALCVYVDPSMIDSPIHHQGGPLFFALSLIPFSLLLMLLQRLERGKHETHPGNPPK